MTFIILFAVVALGIALGAIRIRGVALGAAGVFFVALVAGVALRAATGHLPPAWSEFTQPQVLTDFGLVLFVYSLGLQAGPRIVRVLRTRGRAFLMIAAVVTLVGVLTTLGLARWLRLEAHLAAGLYCGATTCTPAFAAVLDAIRRVLPSDATAAAEFVNVASVGYGAAYPFSVVAMVLTVQLLPRLLRTTTAAAAAQYAEEAATESPPLERCALRVTNRNVAGRTVDELQELHLSAAVISRVKHGDEIRPARPQTVLCHDDVVLAVGAPEELAKLEAALGPVVVENLEDPTGRVSSEQVVVSQPEVAGKSIRELAVWERHGVVVTRVRRGAVELAPRGDLRLEPGDLLRVVGARQDIPAFAQFAGREERRLYETSLIPFAAGIALGAAIGFIPFTLPGGLEVRLGLAGGAFLVALLLGHWGNAGPVRIYVPHAVKQFTREIGLVIFLTGAGLGAGQRFVPILSQSGPQILLAGALVTLVTLAAAALVVFAVLRWNLLYGAGALTAAMTNSAGLGAATNLAPSDAAAVAFASIYPVALIMKLIGAPLLYLVLRGVG